MVYDVPLVAVSTIPPTFEIHGEEKRVVRF
jgi:hypothetical protein